MPEPLHRIVGTAGHIDHGKTTLVRALTGVDTDRLPEEKRRGITIELGFATWRAAEDLDLSIVDVPGHERFVRTMVAGAAGIDLVVLVVSADDGVMPQTREHLAVCELLGVRRGLIVLTKADLADEEMLELVREDVADAVQGTFLEGAPMLACAATTGEGVDEVRDAILSAVRAHPGRDAQGPAFLPVDRVFTKAGFGTVVTGTLLCGELAAQDDVDVLPGPRGRGLRGLKARGVQVHSEARERARAGMRVAVNLRGSDHESVSRGDVVVGASSREPTIALHAEVRVLESASAISERDELALHLGTTDALARVVPLGDGPIEPGATGLLRVVAKTPVVAYAGQRLVLRKPGQHGQGTVAGGRVLDPHPTTGKGSFKRWREVTARIAQDDAADRLLALVADARAEGITEEELGRRLPPGEDLPALTQAAQARGDIVRMDAAQPRWVQAGRVDGVKGALLERVRAFHAQRPLLLGVSSGELQTQVAAHERALVEPALAALVRDGALVDADGAVRLPDHDPASGAAGQTLSGAEALWRDAGLTPPLDDEARAQLALEAPALKDAVTELKRKGALTRLGSLHFHSSALDDLRSRVGAHFGAGKAELSTADFKELAGGVSRKYAIPLLEWLDAEGVTKRAGDVRVKG
jgi:selenocysteine-specific elongation factor